MKLMGGQCLI